MNLRSFDGLFRGVSHRNVLVGGGGGGVKESVEHVSPERARPNPGGGTPMNLPLWKRWSPPQRQHPCQMRLHFVWEKSYVCEERMDGWMWYDH